MVFGIPAIGSYACVVRHESRIAAHIALFDSIAKPYSWFFRPGTAGYSKILMSNAHELGLDRGARVLDVGCGPGTFAAAFRRHGYRASGVDGAPGMVVAARKHGLECHLADATRELPFADDSFDLVCAAYVAHGLRGPARVAMYRQMKRVSTGKVLLHDFSQMNEPFPIWSVTGILERLEGSDYENFIHDGFDEMKTIFGSVRMIEVSKSAAWYLCA